MLRTILPLVLLTAAGSHAGRSADILDPAFQKIPFDQWLNEPGQPRFRWGVNVARAQLSFHQRLVSTIEIEVDGRDLDTRRHDGNLVTFFQIRDRQGTRFQGHGDIELSKLDANVKGATIQTSQRAFFLPGEYELAVAILDTGTGEHASAQSRFKIAAAPSRFLLDAWSDLPAVEFIHEKESPDGWFLPEIEGRLHWLGRLNGQAHLNVILNAAATVPVPGTRATPSEGFPALLPTLKVLSQSGAGELAEHVEVLDLARRGSVFNGDVRGLDASLNWLNLKASLSDANMALIDLHSLADRHHDAQFFVRQVRRLIVAAGPAGVLVILSTPVAFEAGEDLSPISLEGLPSGRVFYVRYRQAPERVLPPYPPGLRGRGRGLAGGQGGVLGVPNRVNAVDQLAATLKPLSPKVFDVETADEMTKVLAQIEKVLSK